MPQKCVKQTRQDDNFLLLITDSYCVDKDVTKEETAKGMKALKNHKRPDTFIHRRYLTEHRRKLWLLQKLINSPRRLFKNITCRLHLVCDYTICGAQMRGTNSIDVSDVSRLRGSCVQKSNHSIAWESTDNRPAVRRQGTRAMAWSTGY